MPEGSSSYPTRHHPRLSTYDYTTVGMYFITICTRDRLPLFGEVVGTEMRPTAAGRMVQDVWEEIPAHYPADIDAFIAMPDHIHGIVVLEAKAPSHRAALSLPDIMQRFKSLTTARYRQGVKEQGWQPFPGTLWQASYFDHVIRDDDDLDRIRRYILENPLRWALKRGDPNLDRS